MNPYLLFVLAILLAGWLLNLLVAALELRSLRPELPPEFSDVFDQEKYRQSQEYARANARFAQVRETCTVILVMAFIVAGGFNRIDLTVRSFGLGPISTGLVFTGAVLLLSGLLNLPFAAYDTFVLEERFGFNKTTVKTFVLDLLKAVLLAIAIGGPLLAAVLWFFQAAEAAAWLYCWLAVTVFTLILQFLAPTLILPLFNKFTPLEDGELRQAVTNYAQAQRFAVQGIYTMDGSKRSAKLNAFFAGFGRFRRIVFFDTLLATLNPGEIVAVLAHEMGHFKHGHIWKMTAASIAQTGIMFYLMSLFLSSRQLFAAFGMAHQSIYAGLIFFGFLYAPASLLLAIFLNGCSRRNEHQADAWAVNTTSGRGKELVSALKKLSAHNLANLTPHPLNVFVNYSHPPVVQRIRAIRELAQED